MAVLISWATNAVGLWLASQLLDGFKLKGGPASLLVVAAVFGVLQFLLGWVVFVAIGIASLGLGFLFALVTRLLVSALMLKLADAVSDRLQIRSFGTAFAAACVLAVSSTVVDWVVR